MMESFIHGRVFVFIDPPSLSAPAPSYGWAGAANILYSQQTLGWRMDYTKLKKYLDAECDLQGVYFYTGHVGSNDKQQSFLQKLRGLGFYVRSKEVKRIKTGMNTYVFKGNLDVELAVDAILHLEDYDTLILMSGDSDFAYLLDIAKERKKCVAVMSSKNHISIELLQRAKYINLSKLRPYIEFLKSPPDRNRGEV